MIFALIILGAVLLVLGMFVPPPGKGIVNIIGTILLVIGVVLLLFALAGAPVVVL
jgi:membrane-bound ClpP family serine protease